MPGSDLLTDHFEHRCLIGGGELVEAVMAVDDPGADRAASGDGAGNELQSSGVRHADDLPTDTPGM